ncbi:MOSC domain-containing protein [Mariniblastus sp.]|nr:MOSC domain-containing protein [Mariniblastus sp.]
MKQLLATMPQVGKVEWIGVRPGRREPLNVLPSVDVSMEGLVGDRYRGKAGGPRMVTLIQQEHIATVESILKIEAIDPGVLRRNVVVSGINLQALKKRRIQIGGAILEVTGNCPPPAVAWKKTLEVVDTTQCVVMAELPQPLFRKARFIVVTR